MSLSLCPRWRNKMYLFIYFIYLFYLFIYLNGQDENILRCHRERRSYKYNIYLIID